MIIAVIIPTYNENSSIGMLLDGIFHHFRTIMPEISLQVVVIDDYSHDGTGLIVKEKMTQYPGLSLISKPREGIGYASITGMKHAITELNASAIVEMDADFQHKPTQIYNLVKEFVNGADLVIGSRYINGAFISPEWSKMRLLLSKYGNTFLESVLELPSISDYTSGFRLTRVKGLLDCINLASLVKLDRFAYKIDLLYKLAKHAENIVETPISFMPRQKGISKNSIWEIYHTLHVVQYLAAQK